MAAGSVTICTQVLSDLASLVGQSSHQVNSMLEAEEVGAQLLATGKRVLPEVSNRPTVYTPRIKRLFQLDANIECLALYHIWLDTTPLLEPTNH